MTTLRAATAGSAAPTATTAPIPLTATTAPSATTALRHSPHPAPRP